MPERLDGPSLAGEPGRPCIVCGCSAWTALPDPGPRSMASDYRVVDEPLARVVCDGCGLARRDAGHDAAAFFESGYALYAHAPGEARERGRQEEYARWIADAVAARPARVLDVGCGNGSLLRSLRGYWPQAELCGCDPSSEAIAQGAGDDLRLWRGTVDEIPADVVVDLVITINVIEHTADPVRFLESLRRRLSTDGSVIVVCPDGSRPGVELLFADHLFSFAPAHLDALVRRAGFETRARSSAPETLGQFQMVVGRRSEEGEGGSAWEGGSKDPPLRQGGSEDPPLRRERAGYLERWRDLDGGLLAHVQSPVVCFGAGEAAGLLRAYAPRTWDLVTACTIDGTARGTFGDLPIVPLDRVSADATLLLGVRPADQPRLLERLRDQFPRVVAWYDLVAELEQR